MPRVALVAGGTRGIGEVISHRLRRSVCAVAATYYGNDARAATFERGTDIATSKWNVAEFSACERDAAPSSVPYGTAALRRRNRIYGECDMPLGVDTSVMDRTEEPTSGIIARPTRRLFFTGKDGAGSTTLAYAAAPALASMAHLPLLY